MSINDSAVINGLFCTPLALPAPVAGPLAALFLVMAIVVVRRATHGNAWRLLFPLAIFVICALAAIAILDRVAVNEKASEQRALLQRDSQLSMSAVASGPLACLDGVAGEQ